MRHLFAAGVKITIALREPSKPIPDPMFLLIWHRVASGGFAELPHLVAWKSSTLDLGNFSQVGRGLFLIARLADRREPFGIVGVVGCIAQRQGRAVIEDEGAGDEGRIAVRAATDLSDDDLDLQLPGKRAPPAMGSS
jgi:hypothetical protein